MKKNLLFFALLLTVSIVYSQESVLLKYNFVEGKTYAQNTSVVSAVTQSMMGQEVKMASDILSNSEIKIESVGKDGSATTLLSVLNASIHSAAMGRDTTIQLKDMNDKNRVVLSELGKELSSVNLDTSKAAMMGSMKQFSKFVILPGKSVKVGEKWQDKTVDSSAASGQNPFAMHNTIDSEYTFIGKESKDGKDYSKIGYTSTMAINGKGMQMGMEMFLEGTGKIEGFFYFDPKSSMVVYNESNTEMDMTMAVSGQQNMTIPMTQSMKTITKIEEKI